jgi:hypothetical protein
MLSVDLQNGFDKFKKELLKEFEKQGFQRHFLNIEIENGKYADEASQAHFPGYFSAMIGDIRYDVPRDYELDLRYKHASFVYTFLKSNDCYFKLIKDKNGHFRVHCLLVEGNFEKTYSINKFAGWIVGKFVEAYEQSRVIDLVEAHGEPKSKRRRDVDSYSSISPSSNDGKEIKTISKIYKQVKALRNQGNELKDLIEELKRKVDTLQIT